MQIVLKGKRGSQWFDLKTVRGCEQNSRFFTMNSTLRIRFHELKIFMNFYEFVHTNFVFVAKLRIHSYEFVRVFSMLCWEWPVL